MVERTNNMGKMNPSIDFLSLRERGVFAELNDGKVIRLDAEGEEVWKTNLSMAIEGSHDTKCRARVQGDIREMTWNPSRFNREDNCLGVTFDQAIAQADSIMAGHGQPPWSEGEAHQYADGKIRSTGTQVTRADVAIILILGSEEKAQEFMRQFYTKKLTRYQPQRRGLTVYHGAAGGRGKTIKAYPKGAEILAHGGKNITPYQRKLAEHLTAIGAVRLEIRYGRMALERMGLRKLQRAVMHEKLTYLFVKDVEQILMKNHTEPDLSGLTNAQLGCYYMYMAGEKVKERYSPKTFYKHRKAILAQTGYDIGNDNVIAFKQKPVVLQPVILTPEMMPDWYRHPKDWINEDGKATEG